MRRGPGRRHRHQAVLRGQAGSSLVMVLAFIVVTALAVGGLVIYTSTNLRTTQTYRQAAERTQDASDAIDAAIVYARRDGTKGLDGTAYSVTYAGAVATCSGQSGSGVPDAGGTADRAIRCEARVDGHLVMTVEFRIVDQGGDNPGAAVEITSRRVST